MAKILVLNGPNLNLLGTREADIYGTQTLAEIERNCRVLAAQQQHQLAWHQSNHEGQLIDWIQQAKQQAVDVIILNASAYTHTSIALREALVAVQIPAIEVHLSNVHKRESFRHHSFLSDIVVGTIGGFGAKSYELAILAVESLLTLSPTGKNYGH